MKLKSILYTAIASATLFLPSLAIAAVGVSVGVSGKNSFFGFSFGSGTGVGLGACSNTICGVGALILFIINQVLVPVLFAVAFIVFLYGVAQAYIFSHGDQVAVSKGHKLVLWGIVAFAVMLSIWGLVNVVATTFGLAGFTAPPTPTSY